MNSVPVRYGVFVCCLVCLALSGPIVSGRSGQQSSANDDLIAHEWGTFTSIAGRDGHPVEWSPLDGPEDLPRFVEHLRTADFKGGLRGTVRMETPVLYFYSPNETTVSVKVSFAQGLITEWYPHASHIEPNAKEVLSPTALLDGERNGSIAWNSVAVSPGLSVNLPQDDSQNHYYAARETGAAPVLVRTKKGVQQEKFLFYRGVSVFSVPVAAQPVADGKVTVRNLGIEEIPDVILFERRGDKLGYRLGGALQGEMELDPPELTSSVESMCPDLEDVLIARGLYPDEARAMIETWKKSWFEQGSRLLYIVPPSFVNAVLPLSINPSPGGINRVFVGRLELITPATEHEVETAIAKHDGSIFRTYGRFFEPILEELRKNHPNQRAEMDRDLGRTYNAASDPASQ